MADAYIQQEKLDPLLEIHGTKKGIVDAMLTWAQEHPIEVANLSTDTYPVDHDWPTLDFTTDQRKALQSLSRPAGVSHRTIIHAAAIALQPVAKEIRVQAPSIKLTMPAQLVKDYLAKLRLRTDSKSGDKAEPLVQALSTHKKLSKGIVPVRIAQAENDSIPATEFSSPLKTIRIPLSQDLQQTLSTVTTRTGLKPETLLTYAMTKVAYGKFTDETAQYFVTDGIEYCNMDPITPAQEQISWQEQLQQFIQNGCNNHDEALRALFQGIKCDIEEVLDTIQQIVDKSVSTDHVKVQDAVIEALLASQEQQSLA